MKQILTILYLLSFCSLFAYEIEIQPTPDLSELLIEKKELNVVKDTTIENLQKKKEDLPDGAPLLDHIKSLGEIDRIVFQPPYTNTGHGILTEERIRERFSSSTSIDSSKKLWHYAPFAGGFVQMKHGARYSFHMYLSGIVFDSHLFSIKTTKEQNKAR